jgi:hypothetical protein
MMPPITNDDFVKYFVADVSQRLRLRIKFCRKLFSGMKSLTDQMTTRERIMIKTKYKSDSKCVLL